MKGKRAMGLRNLGNTCFLNAALQALAHTPLLAPFFLHGLFVKDLNAANPLGTGAEVVTAFAELLQRLFPPGNSPGTAGSVSPDDFYEAVCKHCPLVGEFRGEQQDAHEVMSFLLDALHEDLNRTKTKPPYIERKEVVEEDLASKGEERFAAEAWRDHLLRNKSKVVDLCQGQLRSQLRCVECGLTSVTFDPFLFLSLPLPPGLRRGGKQPIQAAITSFCAEERLEGEDSWQCPRCKRRVRAEKRLSLWKLPLLLLVHLKRFGFEANGAGPPRTWKIEGEVCVPLSRLDLQDFVAQESRQRVPLKYDLFAVVDHVGASASCGHYTAVCRRADGWWRFDDSRAEFLGAAGDEAAAGRVLGEGNYLLLFQRRDAPPEPDLVREQSHRRPQHWPHAAGGDEAAEWSFLDPAELSRSILS